MSKSTFEDSNTELTVAPENSSALMKTDSSDFQVFDNPVSSALNSPTTSHDQGQASPKSPKSPRSRKQKLREKQQKEEEIGEFRMEGTSMGIFGEDHSFRKLCFTVSTNPMYDTFILVLILIGPCTLVAQMPAYVENLSNNLITVFGIFEIVAIIIFTIEALLKIIAFGFIKGNFAYLQNGWNVLDFLLVSMTWISIPLQSETPLFAIFRALRVLRPLRKLRLVNGLGAILEFYPYILNVCGFLLFFFCMFGVIGIQLFGGITSLRCVQLGGDHCQYNNDGSASICTAHM
jgi:hypothetical protein